MNFFEKVNKYFSDMEEKKKEREFKSIERDKETLRRLKQSNKVKTEQDALRKQIEEERRKKYGGLF